MVSVYTKHYSRRPRDKELRKKVNCHGMPTLPPLGGQILRGINGCCVDCDASVDRRSKRCRPCHARRLTARRFPVEKRPLLLCIDCKLPISYASKKGHGEMHWKFVETRSRGRKSEVSLTEQGKSALRIFGTGEGK